MKISFFINRPPPFVGGLQNVCLRVAKHFLESAGAEVRIIGFPDQDNSNLSAKELAWEHEEVEVQDLRRGRREDLLLRWVPFLKKRRATLPMAIACYEWAYSRQISRLCQGSSVFHYFGTGMEMNGYSVADAANKIQAKLVIEPAIHAGTWGDTWLDTPLYKKGDLLLAHTYYEAAVIFKLGIPKSKIRTIVHGVDFCDSGDGGRFLEKHQISGPMVLFLGRKTKEKGVERLLSAWPMVAEKFSEATLVLAGPKCTALRQIADFKWQMAEENSLTTEDTENTELEEAGCLAGQAGEVFSNPFTSEFARDPENTSRTRSTSGPTSLPATSHSLPATAPKALPRVLNLDDLPEGEKQDALAACDILCVPSEGESFGMVYYEAWAYKKPVVALDLPVLRETISSHGGGLLCDAEPQSIANALIQLLSNPELAYKLGNMGHSVARLHDWPKAFESYLESCRKNIY